MRKYKGIKARRLLQYALWRKQLMPWQADALIKIDGKPTFIEIKTGIGKAGFNMNQLVAYTGTVSQIQAQELPHEKA
jgi:hypothetical protein